MTGYRRNFVAGGSFFFTVNLADRRLQLLTESIDALRTAFRETQRHHPFTIDAIVVLPDHLHSVWTLGGRCFRPRRGVWRKALNARRGDGYRFAHPTVW
jgi:REP element-mobilizing transposase RayT